MVTVAYWIWGLVGIYAGLGLLFAIPFLWKGVGRSDPSVAGSTIGFRLIIIPGVVLFWPLLARRWLTGATEPPEETSPHRTAAQAD